MISISQSTGVSHARRRYANFTICHRIMRINYVLMHDPNMISIAMTRGQTCSNLYDLIMIFSFMSVHDSNMAINMMHVI